MDNAPSRAMILAAGLGTRMRPLTNDRPKALVEVNGRALIDHAIDRLVAAGVVTVIVNVHHFADLVIAHTAKRKDVRIVISDERDQILDTGGALKKALPLFEDEPVFTHNCDTIWAEGLTSALTRMARQFDPKTMDALLLLAPIVTSLGYDGRGDFDMGPTGELTRREEQRMAPFAYMGVQIIHPRFLDGAPEGAFSTNRLWDRSIEAKRLFGLRLDGTWMHVGTPEGLADAEEFLRDLKRAS